MAKTGAAPSHGSAGRLLDLPLTAACRQGDVAGGSLVQISFFLSLFFLLHFLLLILGSLDMHTQ